MKVIILNYWQTSIEVAMIPNQLFEDCEGCAEKAEVIESYLWDKLGYSIDAINYMTAPDDEPIPIYQTERDLLTDAPLYVIR